MTIAVAALVAVACAGFAVWVLICDPECFH